MTCSKPARAVRTSSGNPITAIAITTAAGVNTISIPARASSAPSGPRRPNNQRSISPVATGGITSGSETAVSTSALPGNCRRASTHATATPGTSITAVAASAASVVKMVMSRMSAFTASYFRARRGARKPARVKTAIASDPRRNASRRAAPSGLMPVRTIAAG